MTEQSGVPDNVIPESSNISEPGFVEPVNQKSASELKPSASDSDDGEPSKIIETETTDVTERQNEIPSAGAQSVEKMVKKRHPRVTEPKSQTQALIVSTPELNQEVDQVSELQAAEATLRTSAEANDRSPTFKSLFRRSKDSAKGAANQISTDASSRNLTLETEELVDPFLSLSPTKIRKELAAYRRELKATRQEIDNLESSFERNSESIQTIEDESEKLSQWQDSNSRTFISRVQEKMGAEITFATAELQKHQLAVKNLEIVDPGYLLEIRKEFHRLLLVVSALLGGLVSFVSIVKFRDQIPRLAWLGSLYDPNTSGPILVFTLSLVIGLTVWFNKRRVKTKANPRKIGITISLFVLVAFLIWDSSQKNSIITSTINPWVDTHYFEILTWLASSWILAVAAALVVYYRKWSVFQRKIDQQLDNLRAVITGYVYTQQEKQRLELLHKQVNDWMRILANALFRPWQINPDWGTGKEYARHYDTFPFALRVAQALEGNDSKTAELERAIGAHLLKQGWRNKAFEDLVLNVGVELGLSNGKFNVDLLDSDLPHQTNNSRQLLSKYLDFSAKGIPDESKIDGDGAAETTVPITNSYLVKVAKSRLLYLMEKTQTHAIAAARPRVEQIIDDPLMPLRSDDSGIEKFDASESWDDFLTDALGANSVEQFPLGVLTFSESGRLTNLPSQVRTFVVVPKRMINALPALASESIEIVALGDEQPHPVEIIARVDVVGPVDFGDIQLLSGGRNLPFEKEKITKESSIEETL